MAFKEKTTLASSVLDSEFGSSVSIYGYTAVAGSPSDGACYIYRRGNDGIWSQLRKISSSNEFGYSVKLYKNYLVVSSPGSNQAMVYSSSDNFSSPVAIFNKTGSSHFGDSLAISDSYIAVGDPTYNSNRGRVYIYEKNNNAWQDGDEGSLIAPSTISADDYFGSSIAVGNNFIAVGAKGRDNGRGSVYVFEKDSNGEWQEVIRLIASDGISGDSFGCSLSYSDNYLIIGAEYADITDHPLSGAVYIFRQGESWYEVDKISGSPETEPSSDRFGHCVDINGDYLIVGSYLANGEGRAYVYSKKRNWALLKTILPASLSTGDEFGKSVSIHHPYLVVGSPKGGGVGKIYLFEDPPVRMMLAQEFDVNSEFVPSKSSLFLRRAGRNDSSYFYLTNSNSTVIDATNFLAIQQGSDKVILADDISSYTGNGYLYQERNDYSDFALIEYPIKASGSYKFYIWFRVISVSSNTFEMDVFLDGNIVSTVSEEIEDPSSQEWSWVKTSVVIGDTDKHALGIKMKGSGYGIDKIYIDTEEISPFAHGPEYTLSPYITIHLMMYESDGSPTNPIFIYDYKNTIDDVVDSGWYNFNLNVLDSFHGYSHSSDFSGSYYLVLSSTGASENNMVLWEWENNDEYFMSPSCFKF